MAKRKKTFNLASKIKTSLRTLSVYWPPRKEARNNAKRKIEAGSYKNGNAMFALKYECASCRGLFDKEETQVDHIVPVIDPDKGFESWDVYIERLFVEADKLQVLCNMCHGFKSLDENKKRAKKS